MHKEVFRFSFLKILYTYINKETVVSYLRTVAGVRFTHLSYFFEVFMKMQFTRTLLIGSLFMTGATVAQAQVTFGPRVGLNLANVAVDVEDDDDEPDTKILLAPQVGVTLNAQFGNFSIQPSLLFSQKGFRTDEEESEDFQGTTVTYKEETSARLNYAEIPVNFVYTTGEESGFQVFAGPYIGIGLGGKVKYDVSITGGSNSFEEEETNKVEFVSEEGDDENTDYLRRLDAGLNAGVGYKAGAFQAQLGYGLGLGNLIPNDQDGDEPEDEVKNRVIQFSVSYFFGSK